MVKGPSSLCSALVLLAMTFAAACDTNISYQIGEFNNKLTALQRRLDLFDYITEGNVSVLQHRMEIDENVTKQLNETNLKVNNLVNKMDALATDVSKLSALESKFSTVSSNVSRYAEHVNVNMNETNLKVNNLVNKMDALATDVRKQNTLESKFNDLATTVINLVGEIKKTLLNPLSSCVDAFARPLLNRGSGVYNIQLNDSSSPFDVYCMADPKGDLPWMVVQRRVDGTVDFYRNWTEYQRGFGDLEGNFFIGLDKLHSLTTKGEPQELWVMLTDPDGISAHAYYDRFVIGEETEKYSLDVGRYSGSAGDSLTYHKDMKFSTYDKDNDEDGGNCAEHSKSAWWFRRCFESHLNGVYGSTQDDAGLYWYDFSADIGLKYAQMAIRPARK